MARYKLGILLAMAVLFSSFMLGSTGQAQAYGGYQDRDGYYRDGHGGYHHYGYRHHHRGYWDRQNGVRLWINI
jgi:hypothetical protein